MGSAGHLKETARLFDQFIGCLLGQVQCLDAVAIYFGFLLGIVPIPQLLGDDFKLFS